MPERESDTEGLDLNGVSAAENRTSGDQEFMKDEEAYHIRAVFVSSSAKQER